LTFGRSRIQGRKGDDHVENWGKILVLSLGGVAGVNSRYWLGVWINRWASSQFPWATFSINVSGAFAIGFLTALLARWSPHSYLRLLILVGFLGGYTTFSTFAFESVTLWQRGEWVFSLANMAGSVLAGCAAVVLGAALAQGIVQPTWSRLLRMGQYAPEESIEGSGESRVADQPHVPGLGQFLTSEANLGEMADRIKGSRDGEHPTGSHTPEALSQRQRSAEWQGHLPSGRRDRPCQSSGRGLRLPGGFQLWSAQADSRRQE
jgi:CrcB protein